MTTPARLISSLFIALLLLPSAAYAEQTLTTPHFTVVLSENCEEGVVGCDDVTYQGTNRKTGKTITLQGTTNMVMCADGVTPCHIGNYTFNNGAVVYSVYPDGTLTVTEGSKELLNETGEWSY